MVGFLVMIVNLLFDLLTLAIFLRIMLSWIPVNPYGRFMQILYQVTEPVLAPFRRIIPPLGMVDFSPIVALMVLGLVQRIVLNVLMRL